MAFSDHKIAAFTHKITDLPDQPNLPADELKARFDSSPEELRQAHNALCDDADRLDDRVSGIIAETFGDTISKSMLSDELQDEIDAKADTVNVIQKVDLYTGRYTGNGVYPRDITLGFRPRILYVLREDGKVGSGGNAYHFLAVDDASGSANNCCKLTDTGFHLEEDSNALNSGSVNFIYLALK